MSNGNLHHIPDDPDIEEWAEKLGQNRQIKISRSRPKKEEDEEFHQKEKSPRRREKMNREQTPIAKNPPPPRPENKPQTRPIPFLEKIAQLTNLQEKRDKLQEELREIEAERERVLKELAVKHSQVLGVRREVESQIYAQLNDFTPRELGSLQAQLITASEEEAAKIRAGVAELSRIANNAQQTKLAVTAENYLKTAEAFRLIWRGLTLEQREERALVARVSPENAKAFYRAALAYHHEELATKFLEMIPPQWRASIEGKVLTPVEEGEAKS